MKQISILFCVIIFYSNLSFCAQSNQSTLNSLANVLRVGGSIVAGAAAGLYYYCNFPAKKTDNIRLQYYQHERDAFDKIKVGISISDEDVQKIELTKTFELNGLWGVTLAENFIKNYRLKKHKLDRGYSIYRLPKDNDKITRYNKPYTTQEIEQDFITQHAQIKDEISKVEVKIDTYNNAEINRCTIRCLGYAGVAGVSAFMLLSHFAKKSFV